MHQDWPVLCCVFIVDNYSIWASQRGHIIFVVLLPVVPACKVSFVVPRIFHLCLYIYNLAPFSPTRSFFCIASRAPLFYLHTARSLNPRHYRLSPSCVSVWVCMCEAEDNRTWSFKFCIFIRRRAGGGLAPNLVIAIFIAAIFQTEQSIAERKNLGACSSCYCWCFFFFAICTSNGSWNMKLRKFCLVR